MQKGDQSMARHVELAGTQSMTCVHGDKLQLWPNAASLHTCHALHDCVQLLPVVFVIKSAKPRRRLFNEVTEFWSLLFREEVLKMMN